MHDYEYAIKIRSKHTGQERTLGVKYATAKKAEAAAKKDVCLRCNSYSVGPVPVGKVPPHLYP